MLLGAGVALATKRTRFLQGNAPKGKVPPPPALGIPGIPGIPESSAWHRPSASACTGAEIAFNALQDTLDREWNSTDCYALIVGVEKRWAKQDFDYN